MSVLLLRPSNTAELVAPHVQTSAALPSKDQTATTSSPALHDDTTRTTGKYRQRREKQANYENVVYTENVRKPGHRLLATIGGTPKKIRKPSVTESERSTSISSSMDSVDANLRAEETNRYNRLKLSRPKTPPTGVLNYKPRRIHQRLNMTDSESSSSLTDSPDNFDKKAQEIQHYNRLKLNMNRLPNNKKALKGFKILYKDSPREVSTMQNPSTAYYSQGKGKQQLQRSTSSDPSIVLPDSPSSQMATPTSRYHNERHGNKLHAVSDTAMRKSTSFVATKQVFPKSHSSGDIAKYSLATSESTDSSSGTHSQRRFKSRSQSFSDTVMTNVVLRHRKSQQSRSSELSRSVEENIEPYHAFDQSEVSQHMRNRESDHFRERASSESHKPNHRMPVEEDIRSKSFSNAPLSASQSSLVEKPRPLTPLSSHNALHADSSSPVQFIDPVITIPFDTNGGEYHSSAHGFKIVVPRGAVKKRTTVEIQFGITMHGPFEFPSNKKPVSPILWVSAKSEFKLRKAVEITIPHFLDMSNGGDRYSKKINKGMSFLKASEKMATPFQKGRNSQLYQFKVASENEECFWPNESHGTISTKSLCFFCIAAAKSNPELKPRYCIIPVIPKIIQKSSWKIHYCVTYLLKTSIQVVKKQFGEGWEVLPPRRFKFLEDGREVRIGIQFQRAIPGTGWILALESDTKIRATDVDLWDNEDGEVGVMESMKIYPKRFTIRVHGEDARCASVTQVSFMGATEDINTEIVLPLRTVRGRESLNISSYDPTSPLSSSNRTSLQRPSSSVSSSQHCETCPCEVCGVGRGEEEEEGGADYDHLPTMHDLNRTHSQLTYHNGYIDMPSDEDLHQVAEEVTKAIQEDWPSLQAPLDIPDHIMLDVLHQRTILQQVYRLLKEWKKYTVDCSKGKLAQCLRITDARLQPVAEMLLAAK